MEFVYQPLIIFLCQYSTRTFKSITDDSRIPDVTVGLGCMLIEIITFVRSSISPMNDWHTWLRHHFFPTAEQPGGYQSPRKHTVMRVSRDYKIIPKHLLRGYDCLPWSVLPDLKRPKQVYNHAVCSGQTGQTNWSEHTCVLPLTYMRWPGALQPSSQVDQLQHL